MLKIGITGGIGSGKTTVCKIFELLRVPVFYADDEAKKLMNDDFNVKNDIGVVNYLIGLNSIDESIQKTHIPHLDVMTSGPIPPNPSELILGDSMKQMMDELKNRYESYGISTYALHPGAVKTAFGSETSLWAKLIIEVSKLIFISPKAGAQTSIFLATTPKSQLRNGGYYIKKKPKTPSTLARNQRLSAALWNFSEETLQNLGVI